MVMSVKFFLLVFDRSSGGLIGDIEEFDDPAEAIRARFRYESEYRDSHDVEVVVLGAESREALENTHSRYFGNPRELSLT